MKKQLLFVFLLLGSLGAYSQAVWLSQATGFADVSTGVRNVSAVDANVVWISTYDGSGGALSRTDYSRTTDGGTTWTPGTTPAPVGYDWSMIYGVDANNAWAMYYNATAGSGGGIWHTTDGGMTWNQQGTGTIFNASSFPDVVYFWNANMGVAFGDPNPGFEIYTTVDGGTTWTPVPTANIPVSLTGEYGIVGHYSVIGNTIWFDTNKGRVYRSTDNGLTWTVGSTGITIPANNAMNICFYSATNGIARLYDQTAGTNIMKVTSDGGDTWTAATPTGNFFGDDVQYVPGTVSRLVSTGAAPGFIGSSYSDDGGLTWVDIELLAQRTALGVVDSVTMWAGGFTSSPTSDGIFRYTVITPVSCTDPSVSAGNSVASDSVLCFGDTLTVTSTGVVAPTTGTYAGVSWVISSADISGSNDPLNEPSLVAAYTFNFPAPSTSLRLLVNDGTFIGSATGPPYGIYYWTPVVFGNATAVTIPPQFLLDLSLDPTCTVSGMSVVCNVLAPGDPLCTTGISENANNSNAGMINLYPMPVKNNLNVDYYSKESGKVTLSVKDFTGREVYSNEFSSVKGKNNFTLDLSNKSAGVYFLSVTGNESTVVSKFVKD